MWNKSQKNVFCDPIYFQIVNCIRVGQNCKEEHYRYIKKTGWHWNQNGERMYTIYRYIWDKGLKSDMIHIWISIWGLHNETGRFR